MPLIRSRLIGFSAAAVKAEQGASVVALPVVTERAERVELCGEARLMREIGLALVSATEPAALFCARQAGNRRQGQRQRHNLAQAAAAGEPLLRPSGGAL
jgi:hypothetical protein